MNVYINFCLDNKTANISHFMVFHFLKKFQVEYEKIVIEDVEEEDVVEERNDVHGRNGTSPPQKASIYLRGLST